VFFTYYIGGMVMDSTFTHFASANRVDADTLERHVSWFDRNQQFRQIVGDLPEMIMILNECRQTVYVNNMLCGFIGADNPRNVYGQRPGEIFKCIHASECNGCGTTEFCRFCGAAQAIVNSFNSRCSMNIMECSITTHELDSLELKVYAISWPKTEMDRYTMVVIKDISDSKWRNMMEKIFFHDILNILSALKSMVGLELTAPGFSKEELIDIVLRTTNELIEEINSHRDIIAAEDRRLKTDFGIVFSSELLDSLMVLFLRIFSDQGKKLSLHEANGNISFRTDIHLLKRVISNMLKNALEASAAGDEIILETRRYDDSIEISVRNPGDMPEQVRFQMFKRSFSTKGRNRGLGTYSMKLLTERYLRGKVSFSCDVDSGTTFSVVLPLEGNGEG